MWRVTAQTENGHSLGAQDVGTVLFAVSSRATLAAPRQPTEADSHDTAGQAKFSADLFPTPGIAPRLSPRRVSRLHGQYGRRSLTASFVGRPARRTKRRQRLYMGARTRQIPSTAR